MPAQGLLTRTARTLQRPRPQRPELQGRARLPGGMGGSLRGTCGTAQEGGTEGEEQVTVGLCFLH